MNGVIYGNITNMTPLYNFIDDSYFAKMPVLRHLSLMMILFGFRYFAPKWQKIPAGVYPRLMQNGNPACYYLGNQKSFHLDMAITSSHNKQH